MSSRHDHPAKPMNPQGANLQFCSDSELGYLGSRTVFEDGGALSLDASYRLAHLPLVAPDHPDVIHAREGAYYQDGRHPEAFSLVMPLDGTLLRYSEAYLALEHDFRSSPFAGKIAWSVVSQRWSKLHATVCGGLGVGTAPRLDQQQRRALESIGPVHVEVRGMFSGNVNLGRLYLRVYPERRGSDNAFHQIQRALGRQQTDLFLVGLYNLTDHLDGHETAALRALLQRWWSRLVLRVEIAELWLLGAGDDLVLDSRVAEVIRLSR